MRVSRLACVRCALELDDLVHGAAYVYVLYLLGGIFRCSIRHIACRCRLPRVRIHVDAYSESVNL